LCFYIFILFFRFRDQQSSRHQYILLTDDPVRCGKHMENISCRGKPYINSCNFGGYGLKRRSKAF
jgi:hypothetical protein